MVRALTVLSCLVLLAACNRAPDAASARGASTPSATPAAGQANPPQPALPITPPTPAKPGVLAGDPVEGLRVATIAGCNGCHGSDGGGRMFHEIPGVARLVAPNLTQRRALYDDAGIAALLHEGKTHDGHRPWGMPIYMFQHLADDDVANITAWLRALPPVDNPTLPEMWLAPPLMASLVDGTSPFANDVHPDPGNQPPAVRPTGGLALGKHVAMTSCPECHGRTLDGSGPEDAPGLVIAKAYSAAHFKRLMRTGLTATGKPSTSGLMTLMGQERFPALTDAEVVALKAYLDTRVPGKS